jgi:hypothetical protein
MTLSSRTPNRRDYLPGLNGVVSAAIRQGSNRGIPFRLDLRRTLVVLVGQLDDQETPTNSAGIYRKTKLWNL